MSKKLVILGAGGYANTVKDVSEQLGYDVIAMLDDRFADRTLDSFTKYIADDTEFIPAFGNNEFRLSWCDKITRADGRLATVVHPSAYVSPTASVEKGVVVLPKAVIYQYRCDSETWLYHQSGRHRRPWLCDRTRLSYLPWSNSKRRKQDRSTEQNRSR